jgi:PAS domain S-box-containing protein
MSLEADIEFLQMLIKHSDQLFLTTDSNYTILKISHNWDHITGLKRENCIGELFTDYVLDFDKKQFHEFQDHEIKTNISLKFDDLILGFCCKIVRTNNEILIILTNCQELVQLQNNEYNLSKLLDSVYATIPFCMGIVKDRIVIEVNQYMCDLLGYEKEELLNKSARILYPDDYQYSFVGTEKYKVMNKLGKAYVETKWISKNGTIIDIVLGSSYINNDDRSAGTFFSATEKNKDIRLNFLQSHSSSAFEIFLESSNDGIIHHDSSYRILTWNKVSERIFGIKAEDILNKCIQDFSWEIYSSDGNLLDVSEHPSLISLETGKEISNVILKVVSKNNLQSWISVTSTPIFDNNSNLESVLIVFKDITNEYQLTEKIKSSEKLYRLIAEKTTDVIWLLGLDGKSIYVSPSIESFTGYTQEEYLQQKITDRFVPEETDQALNLFKTGIELYLKNGMLPVDFSNKLKLQYLCKDGSVKWGELIVTPFLSDDGKLIGIHGVTRDVTKEVNASEELARKIHK